MQNYTFRMKTKNYKILTQLRTLLLFKTHSHTVSFPNLH
jgi:hypothetical protein